jgi:hypothetical protein
MKSKYLCLAAFAALAFAGPALAHHSFAMFANDKIVTLKGTVTELEWVNPHAWLHMSVANKAGKSEDWSFEMASPGQLASKGWKGDSVKAGDKITLTMHPMKDGSHGGSYVSVILANGATLGGVRPALAAAGDNPNP